MSTFIIAEAGVNHNADANLALQLIEAAAQCGADAVKFQSFSADQLVVPGTSKAEYQRRQSDDGDQYSMLKALEMSAELHRQLAAHCVHHGIEFMSTPFDEDAADLLLALGMKRIKVPSGEITNEPLLEHVAAKPVPLIVSTGMATMAEVQRAVAVIRNVRQAEVSLSAWADAITLLHCTSNYPAASADVNLRAMQTLAQELRLPVGYSDHTLGVAVATAAVAMGAGVIEKHFTLDKALPGPDHNASLNPAEFKAMVGQIRDVEIALGSAIKQPTVSELPIRALARRSVTVVAALSAGQVIGRNHLALRRPGTGIAPAELSSVVGRSAARELAPGTTLQWTDVR